MNNFEKMMIANRSDWEDVLRRKTAKNEEEYQRKMNVVFEVLGIDPTKGTPMKKLKPGLFDGTPAELTEEQSKAYDEYYETKIKEKI